MALPACTDRCMTCYDTPSGLAQRTSRQVTPTCQVSGTALSYSRLKGALPGRGAAHAKMRSRDTICETISMGLGHGTIWWMTADHTPVKGRIRFCHMPCTTATSNAMAVHRLQRTTKGVAPQAVAGDALAETPHIECCQHGNCPSQAMP